METWKHVAGYEGEYMVSSDGRIKSLKGINERIMKLKRIWSGYMHVCLCSGNKKRDCSVHTLVLEAFDRPRPDGLVANHKDGNKANNAISNLEWVTQSDNAKHSYYTLGNTAHCVPPRMRGEEHPQSVGRNMSEQIKRAYDSGVSSREVGKMFGTSKTTVMKIVNNKHWSNN